MPQIDRSQESIDRPMKLLQVEIDRSTNEAFASSAIRPSGREQKSRPFHDDRNELPPQRRRGQ
jgi:hypothetical protein